MSASQARFKATAAQFSTYLAQNVAQRPQNREDLKNLYQQWCEAMKKPSSGFAEILYILKMSGVVEVKEQGVVIQWKEQKLQKFKPGEEAIAVATVAAANEPKRGAKVANVAGVHLVCDRASCERATALLLKEKMLTLDCEGNDLGKSFDSLGLIQIGIQSGDVYLFDPVKVPGGLQGLLNAGLRQVLQGSSYKFMHDCRMDVAALYLDFKKGAKEDQEDLQFKIVFDTQIMFGLLNPDETEVGLLRLLKTYGGTRSSGHPGKQLATQDWKARELSKEAVEYAAADVKLLFPAMEEMVQLLARQKRLHEARDRSTARVLQQLETIRLNLAAVQKCCFPKRLKKRRSMMKTTLSTSLTLKRSLRSC